MFSLRWRRSAPRAKRTQAKADEPEYPRHEEAFEYRSVEPERIVTEEDVTVAENLLLKADLKPLPRCPRCNTAVGEGQRSCHACEKDLRKML